MGPEHPSDPLQTCWLNVIAMHGSVNGGSTLEIPPGIVLASPCARLERSTRKVPLLVRQNTMLWPNDVVASCSLNMLPPTRGEPVGAARPTLLDVGAPGHALRCQTAAPPPTALFFARGR